MTDTPMSKLEEIERALESLTEELAAEIEGRYASTKGHPAMERRYRADMEEVKVGRRALTLVRELRENAVEVQTWDNGDEHNGWRETYPLAQMRDLCLSAEEVAEGRPALLILSEHKP